MIYRKIDENGDYVFGRRDEFLRDTEAVAQAVRTRLLLLKGEWWENTEDGTPFFEEVAGAIIPEDVTEQIDLVFSERINGTAGVAEITAFESSFDPHTRKYTAQITVETIYGEYFTMNVGEIGGMLSIRG